MKIKSIKVAALLCATSLFASSCVGSFALVNCLAQWNKEATDSMFLNELIFLVISPIAYPVAGLVDVLVLNSIEFWTDDNPMEANVGKTRMVIGSDGERYEVTTRKKGYEIKNSNGDVVEFRFDKKTKTWSGIVEGKEVKLVAINNDGTVKAFLQDGREICVTMDGNGLNEAKSAVYGAYADLAIR